MWTSASPWWAAQAVWGGKLFGPALATLLVDNGAT
jgi:hypothetical protein